MPTRCLTAGFRFSASALRTSTSDAGEAAAPATRPTEPGIDEIVARALRAAGGEAKQSGEGCNRLSGAVAGRPRLQRGYQTD